MSELRKDITQLVVVTIVYCVAVYGRIHLGVRLTPPEPLWWAWLLLNGTTAGAIGVTATWIWVRRRYDLKPKVRELKSNHANLDRRAAGRKKDHHNHPGGFPV